MNESCCVLVINNDPEYSQCLCTVLEAQNRSARAVHSGKDAIAACRTQLFDLILLDLQLQDIPGLKLIPLLEEVSRGIDVIVMAELASLENAIHSFHPQIAGYLAKPIDIEQLHRMVDRIADRKRIAQENRQLQQTIERAKRQWEATFDAITDPILIVNHESTIIRMNRVSCQLFGKSFRELLGQKYGELLAGNSSHPKEWSGQAVIQSGQPTVVETDSLAIPGTFSIASYPVELESGPGVVHFLRNITDRIRAEQRLRVLNEIARLVNQSLDLQSSLQTAVDAIQRAVPAARIAVFTLLPRENLLTLIALSEILPEPSKSARELFRTSFPITGTRFEQALTRGKPIYCADLTHPPFPAQRTLVENDILSDLVAPIQSESEIIGAMALGRKERNAFSPDERAFIEDVSVHLGLAMKKAKMFTELRSAYDELRNTQRQIVQQERLKAMGTMASGIAHDFNNLLMAILGYTELLQSKEDLSATKEVYACNIHTAAQDAARVVSRLRDFYRPQENLDTLTPVNLNEVVIQTIALTQPKWRNMALANGAEIDIRTELDTIPPILGNAAEMREMLTNLILNAVDAMPKGGILTIRTSQVPVSAHPPREENINAQSNEKNPPPPAQEILLEIADTGIGMTDEVRQHCLEPFFTTKGDRGTGLGLAMVYGVVQRHHGHIAIASEVGKGTTFQVWLPTLTTQKIASAESTIRPVRKLRTLVVDDEPHVREILAEYLKADGHSVVTADDGESALAKFIEDKFDLVLTDKGMPGLNGEELAQCIQEIAPGIPIIMVTGWGGLMRPQEERPSGVIRVLGKPITRQDLQEVIASITQG
jgi:PAS domain S-box-containing protein